MWTTVSSPQSSARQVAAVHACDCVWTATSFRPVGRRRPLSVPSGRRPQAAGLLAPYPRRLALVRQTSFSAANETKVLLLMRIVEVNAPKHLRLSDHDARSVGF